MFIILYLKTDRIMPFDCSDASFGYPGGPILFKNLNFGIDLDSRVASKLYFLPLLFYLKLNFKWSLVMHTKKLMEILFYFEL